MRSLIGEQALVRIYIGEAERWRNQQLSTALVERLRREGFAGATVTHGLAGFGAKSLRQSTAVLRLSDDLPIIVEVVDTREQVERLRPFLDEMIGDGLVTVSNTWVVKHGPPTTAQGAPQPHATPPAT
jgi:hypothetical protein